MAKLSDEINQLKYEVGRFLYLTSAKPLNKTPLNILMALVIVPSFERLMKFIIVIAYCILSTVFLRLHLLFVISRLVPFQ